jgi:hypothetical protein
MGLWQRVGEFAFNRQDCKEVKSFFVCLNFFESASFFKAFLLVYNSCTGGFVVICGLIHPLHYSPSHSLSQGFDL